MPALLLMVDNFDSFTYNLVQAFQMLGADIRVVRNDAQTVEECLSSRPTAVIVGPGPGNPFQAGISRQLILGCAGKVPVLGVCLGHQCLAEVFGGKVVMAPQPMHGKTSPIYHAGDGVFAGLPQGFNATRYHSLLVERCSLPPVLSVSAETKQGEIMGLRHREYFLEGVQFHPESILTESGHALLGNFLKKASKHKGDL